MVKKADRRVFIDTNVLIYANVAEAPFHHEALGVIKELHRSGDEIWLSRQVLREYLCVLTRSQKFSNPKPVETLAKRISFFERHFKIADEGADVTSHLLKLMLDIPIGGKQIHDANIVATMLANDISRIVTHNVSDFSRFNNLISIVSIN